MKCLKTNNSYKSIYIFLFCFLLFFVNSIGIIIERKGTLVFRYIIISILVTGISSYLLSKILCKFSLANICDSNYQNYDNRKNILFISFVLFLSFVPSLLAYYPAIVSYDIESQIQQILTSQYTRFHPLLHTFLIQVCLELGNIIFKSNTIGILIYSLFQMAIMSYCISYGLNYLLRHNIKKVVVFVILIYYIIMPYNAIMSISTTKDVIFSGLTLVLYCKIDELIKEKKRFSISFMFVFILWLAFRNNAFFAFLLCSIIVLLFFKKRTSSVIIIISILICNFVLNTVVDLIFKPETISTEEIISVPGSQIARAAILNSENIKDEYLYEINELFQDSYHYYNPYLFDDIKVRFIFGISNVKDLLEIWIKVLPSSLKYYIEAFLELNRGSWYLLDTSYTNVYMNKYYDLEIYKENSNAQIGYIETRSRKIIGIDYYTFSSNLHNYYESVCTYNILQCNIISRIISSPALSLWTLILSLFINVYRRKYKNNIPIILLLSYWCTVLLGPCTLFRYMYPIVITAPICLARAISNE